MYKRILLAYDGSLKGRAALREGALLARSLGARVFLLSVVAEAVGSRVAGAADPAAVARREDYEAVLQDGVARLRRLGFDPVAKLAVGEPAQEIGAFADEVQADLVVVAHQRQSAFERWWSGPGGAHLIDYVRCSMLVSRNEMTDEAFAAELGRVLGPTPEPVRSTDPVPPSAEEKSADANVATQPSRRRLRFVLYAVVPVCLLLIGIFWYVRGGRVVTLTNAYVNSNKVGISTDVAGTIVEISVRDNQSVQSGQLLYRLDPQQFRIALQRAQAQIGITRASLEALKSSYQDTAAQLRLAEADLDYYTREFRRTENLLKARVASQSAYETARRNLEGGRQKLASARQQLAGAAANLNGRPEGPIESNPRYLDAVAQRDEAARQLAHTIVKAPFAGIVTDVTAIAVGRYLPVSTTAFYLVESQNVWVDANPKETELTHMRTGQPATVRVDAYPGVIWHGTVESISPAAAQEFALLPAQNTSGNWVKVVQRIPIRVHVDTHDPSLPPLRVGMSVEVAVDTGHSRGWPGFLSGSAGQQGH